LQSLLERGLSFVMRCDNDSGWPAVREFVHSGRSEAVVTLNKPSARDAADWGCQRQAPQVRLVRQVAPSGAIRVLATNLTSEQAPAADFGDLYHQRWRIEEAFKLDSRLSLSPDGRNLFSAGWVWHAVDHCSVFDVETAFAEPAHLKGAGIGGNDLWADKNSAAFPDDGRLAVA
jgi:Transposase DDE domain